MGVKIPFRVAQKLWETKSILILTYFKYFTLIFYCFKVAFIHLFEALNKFGKL